MQQQVTFLILLCFSLLLSPITVTANDLKNHASPYLAMHGDDPVDWMDWGDAALTKAKKENKLLFVSIGYYACHWCHVMHRESYSNKAIAQKINADFIPVKVDRELNPVLDKRLIEFVSATTGSAGWPLNVFLTPDGYPLVGATYIPPKQFSKSLTDLSGRWEKNSEKMALEAKEFSQRFTATMEKQESQEETQAIAKLKDKLLKSIMDHADTFIGGFGDQRKFPSLAQLQALFDLNKQQPKKEVDDFIKLTLDAMKNKGLHDEIGGGFYRYTTDPGWQTPHFEKMLYTNALAPILYFQAADLYDNNHYRETALETLYFLQHSMQGESGAFISSLSAVDDKGIEGAFYLWTQTELKKILNDMELKLANSAWNLDRANDHEAGNLPTQEKTTKELAILLDDREEQINQQLIQLKDKLKTHREKTRKVPRDDKLLTSWNGLALAGFASGIKADPKLKVSAKKLAEFLISMWDGKQLRRSAANNKEGTLSDYAAVSWGLISWGQKSQDKAALKIGTTIAKTAWADFYQKNNWLETRQSLLPQGVQQSHLTDEPYPSAETLLLRASYLSGDKALKAKANQLIKYSSKSVEKSPYSYASLIAITVTHEE